MTEEMIDREFGWEDEIKNDSPDWVLLPEDDYTFTVTGFERARYEGGAKLPPCRMAKLTIKVHGDTADATVTHRLYLHSRCEGLLCAFFESIGQRKHGEPLRPRWDELIGATGLCHLGIREYTKKSGSNAGETGKANEIQKFLPPLEPMAQPQQGSWTQGAF